MSTDSTQMPPRTIDLTGLPAPVVEQILRIVHEARRQLAEQGLGAAPDAARPPLIGRFANLGYSIPKEALDEAQREAWAGFPRDFPEPDER